jgi:hypothetical protein
MIRWYILAGFGLIAVAVAIVTIRLRAVELKVAMLQARANTPKTQPVAFRSSWGMVQHGAPAGGQVVVRRLGENHDEDLTAGAYLGEGQYVTIRDGAAYPTPYPGD